MTKQYVLYQHAGSGNHGCEALVRTVIATIQQIHEDAEFVLVTSNIEDDKKYGIDQIVNLELVELNNTIRKWNMNWFRLQLGKLLHIESMRMSASFNLDWIRNDRCYIAIGGDNYCYNKGKSFYSIDNAVKGKKILWGCSVEPDDLDEALVQHLSRFDMITVREPVSMAALQSAELKNVRYAPDTAFILPGIGKESKQSEEIVGINISPMILNYAKDADATMANYSHLVDYIINETGMSIMFVPHVVSENNDDRLAIDTLVKTCDIPHNRFTIIEDANCQELKGAIGMCSYFIGARTHSTIAAYSQRIPTLVMGYSVKSVGIAQDLFGTSDNYVISVSSLSNEDALTDAFKWIVQNREDVQDRLDRVIPEKQSMIIEIYQKILSNW